MFKKLLLALLLTTSVSAIATEYDAVHTAIEDVIKQSCNIDIDLVRTERYSVIDGVMSGNAVGVRSCPDIPSCEDFQMTITFTPSPDDVATYKIQIVGDTVIVSSCDAIGDCYPAEPVTRGSK